MEKLMRSKLERLTDKGVYIPNPESIFVAEDVDTDRISGVGVTLHPGCRLQGAATLVCRGAILGEEGPVTIENCQIGPGVHLKGGFFQAAVFLEKASMGAGAHVREGTILEEGASGAHCVGFKQTILFPYVTVGSLINFCDCLMAGGTGRNNHSEVGSSYIHFNFTPNQDKATASLIGDVPKGVMLNQPPIFLGGQGGLVGPSRLAYGTIIAAGSIYRKDELRPGRLLSSGGGHSANIPHAAMMYRSVKRVVQNNIIYIANLLALQQWYQHVRAEFVSDDFPPALLAGLHEKVGIAISERLKRLKGVAEKMPESAKNYRALVKEGASELLLRQKTEFHEKWPEIEATIKNRAGMPAHEIARDSFLKKLELQIQTSGKNYIGVIRELRSDGEAPGLQWLQGIVDQTCRSVFGLLPSFGLIDKP